MNFWDTIVSVLTNEKFLGAVFATIAVILISYVLRRKEVLGKGAKGVLTTIIMKIGLPCLAFNSFMKDLNSEEFKTSMSIMIFSIALHLILILVTKLFFKKQEAAIRKVWRMCLIFGNVSFFSMPILEGVYGNDIVISENLILIGFRIFLYSYAFYVMSGLSFHFTKKDIGSSIKKIFLNPIMMGTLLGLLIWALQNVLPQVSVNGVSYCFLRIDKTLPILYTPITYLKSLATPLSWILIGVILGEANFKTAFKNKKVWLLSLLKTFAVPAFTLAILVLVSVLHIATISRYGAIAMVIMMAAPVSTVINAYAAQFDNQSYFVSDMCLISTLTAIVAMPIFIVITEAVCSMVGLV